MVQIWDTFISQKCINCIHKKIWRENEGKMYWKKFYAKINWVIRCYKARRTHLTWHKVHTYSYADWYACKIAQIVLHTMLESDVYLVRKGTWKINSRHMNWRLLLFKWYIFIPHILFDVVVVLKCIFNSLLRGLGCILKKIIVVWRWYEWIII